MTTIDQGDSVPVAFIERYFAAARNVVRVSFWG